MNRPFKSLLAPTDQPRVYPSYLGPLVKDGFKLHTLLVFGALLQLMLCLALPLPWAAVPSTVLILNSLVTTIVQCLKPHSTSFTANTIPRRATTQLPQPDGSHDASPIVVFNLGVQFNHPLGILAPAVSAINSHLDAMNADLKARRDETGFLGVSQWFGNDRASHNTTVLTYYFRDVESVHRFAQGALHRRAWDFYSAKKHRHVGIFHETFCVPRSAYETVFVNCHPVLTGRIAVREEEGEGEGRWLSPLVSADTPALKTQYARLRRDERGSLYNEKV